MAIIINLHVRYQLFCIFSTQIIETMKTIHLKKLLLCCFLFPLFLISCKNNTPKTTYYKYERTGKIFNQTSYNKLKQALSKNLKTIKGQPEFQEIFTDSVISGDSIIKTFEFKVKLGIKQPESIFEYINNKLPDHTFHTLEGKKIEMAQLIGKPTLINFWFTTCHPCVDEIPVLNRIREKYEGRVHFISITFNSRQQVTKFIRSHPYDFIKVVDAQNYISTLRINNFPVNVFLDKNGIVKRVENGIPYHIIKGKMVMGNGKQFEQYLDKLL